MPRGGRLSRDGLLVGLVWTLLLISVQPWSISTTSGSQGSSAGKGVLVVTCLLISIVAAPGHIRGRVPAVWWCYAAYVGLVVASVALLGGATTVLQRSLRLSIVLGIPLALWPILRRSPTRLLSAMFAGYLLLALLTLVGPVLRPAAAFKGGTFSAGGRLMGAFLPVLPTRVGEIGAIVAGLAVLYWAFDRLRTALAVSALLVGVALLYLSRTRTAAGALALGLVIAAALSWNSAGGRRLRTSILLAVCVALPGSPLLISWIERNQSADQIASLTGRTVAWNYILHLPVNAVQLLLGHGLGHTSIFIRRADNTLALAPIDSSWITLYYESGLIGLTIVAVALLLAVRSAVSAPTPFVRACCTFLLTYVAIAGISETGLSDASSLLLLVVVAAMTADIDARSASANRAATRIAQFTRPVSSTPSQLS